MMPVKMWTTYIESLGVYLPSTEVLSKARAAGIRTRIKIPLERFTGIQSTRHAGADEFSFDLACRAIERCLRYSSFRTEDIGLVIACNISKYDQAGFVFPIEPNTATRLRKTLGFKNAIAFDVNNACAGIFTGILVADCYLHESDIKAALVVSGEYLSHLAETAQREIESVSDSRLACLTLGDAGAAVVLARSKDPAVGFQHVGIETFGAHSSLCRGIPAAQSPEGAILLTDSGRLLEVATPEIARQFQQTLAENSWSPDMIDHLIPHQISRRALEVILGRINAAFNGSGIPMRKVIDNLAKRGNTASTSHFVALQDYIENNRIRPGDRLAFVVAASGLNVGTALYIMDKLPLRLQQPAATSKRAVEPDGTPATGASPQAVSVVSIATSRTRRHAPSSTEDIACETAETCLANAPCSRQDIGVLLFTGVFKSDFVAEPSYASIIAGRLFPLPHPPNDGRTLLAFDVYDGPNGFLTACEILRLMMGRRGLRAGLVVSAEFDNNRLLPGRQRLGIAETASAAVIMASSHSGLHITNCRSFPFEEHVESFRASSVCVNPAHVRLHVGADYEARLRSSILRALGSYLPSTGRRLADFDEFYFPQVSSRFLNTLGEELEIPRDRIVDVTIDGDLYTSSLPCALEQVAHSASRASGKVGLAISAGPGINVSCAVVHA